MRITIIIFVAFAFSHLSIAQTPAELIAKLPPIAGWSVMADEMETYNPDNLYDKINGAAPAYIVYDFKEMTFLEYIKDIEGDDLPPYISIQIYRHGSPTDAFGIYASERPLQTNFISAGTQGYQEGAMLNFFVDNLYVKIESPHTDDEVVNIVRRIAQEFGSNVNNEPFFPPVLFEFPAENKIENSELFIPSDFLGHQFLTNAFSARYEASGRRYQLFIIDTGSIEQANALLIRYLQFTRQDTDRLSEGRLTINDRFNGDIEVQWKGRYIWGIVNDNNAQINVEGVLRETGRNFM